MSKPLIALRWLVCAMAATVQFSFSASRVVLTLSFVALIHPKNHSSSNNANHLMAISNSNQTAIESVVDRATTTVNHVIWTQSTCDKLFAVLFFGGILSPIPAGRIIDKVGPRLSGAFMCTINGLTNLLFPFTARWDINATIVLLFINGCVTPPYFSAISVLVARWAPKYERTLFICLISAGGTVGTIVSDPLVGLLCDLDYLGGWPLAFYIIGVISVCLGIVWYFLVSDEPENHPLIKQSEKDYIAKERSAFEAGANLSVPWAQIAISGPIWGLILSNFATGWFGSVMNNQVPEFFESTFNLSLEEDGLYSALPWLGSAIAVTFFSYGSDKLRETGKLSTTAIRKICSDIGFILAPTFLVMATLFGDSSVKVLICVIISNAIAAAQSAGVTSVHLDLSPTFSGTLAGLISTIYGLSGMAMTQAAFYLVGDNPDLHHWSNLFLATAAICIIGTHYFALLGSSKLQKWDPTFESEEKAIDDDLNGDSSAATVYDPEIYIIDQRSGSIFRKFSKVSLPGNIHVLTTN